MWRFIIRHKVFFIAVLSLLLIKMLWETWSCWGNGSLDDEKDDLLQRRNYLVDKIMVEPLQLLRDIQKNGQLIVWQCDRNFVTLQRTPDGPITGLFGGISKKLST